MRTPVFQVPRKRNNELSHVYSRACYPERRKRVFPCGVFNKLSSRLKLLKGRETYSPKTWAAWCKHTASVAIGRSRFHSFGAGSPYRGTGHS